MNRYENLLVLPDLSIKHIVCVWSEGLFEESKTSKKGGMIKC